MGKSLRCIGEGRRRGSGLRGGGAVRRILVAVALLFLVAGGAGRVEAQAVKGEIVSVGIGGIAGKGGVYRAGSWVPVQVRVENRSGQQFVGRLGVDQQLDLDGDKAATIGSKFILQANEVDGRTLWTYYWPRPDDFDLSGIKSVIVFDPSGQQPLATLTTPGGFASAQGIGKMDSNTYRSMRFVVVLGSGRSLGWRSFVGAWGGTEGVRSVALGSANQLPDDVKGLDGVDVIVWQADAMKPSDIPPEFQLKAMLDWVRAGGHLIISVGTQGQEFVKGNPRLLEAIPLTPAPETRRLTLGALAPYPFFTNLTELTEANKNAPLIQVQGALKPGARPITGGTAGEFKEHPLAVTGLYGRGVVTMITFDVGSAEFEAQMNKSEVAWIKFWNQMAGWQSGGIITAAQYEKDLQNKVNEPVVLPPGEIRVGDAIATKIDVTDVTSTRILVAVLFLALYWFLAGPVGHLVLRAYRVVHWSWWVFGATVVAATGVAGAVVLVLHVATYDVRHKSFVLGTVNSDEVSVASFYGVYAPASGHLELRQPEGTGGMNYLVPLCLPTTEDVKPFADPQSYEIWVDHPSVIAPVFRNTLKKMQARWTGNLPGIRGSAAYTKDGAHLLKGTLTNNSGYDLQEPDIIVNVLQPAVGSLGGVSRSYLFHVRPSGKETTWKTGVTIDLEKALVLEPFKGPAGNPRAVSDALKYMGWKAAPIGYRARSVLGAGPDPTVDQLWVENTFTRDDLFYLLMDTRALDPLNTDEHREVVRGVGRLTDSTKSLYAAGALIVAHAGDLPTETVKSPVPLSVNGKEVAGKGEILFGWALPVAGASPEKMEVKAEAASPAAAAGAGVPSLVPDQRGQTNVEAP